MSFLCERCGAEFEELQEYKDHKVDHVQGRVANKSVEELAGIMDAPDMGTPGPTATGEQIQAEPLKPTTKPTKPPWSEPEPITLTYRYDGNCPTCRGAVETLDLEGVADKGKVVVVAWCPACKKKVSQRIVVKL